MTEVQFSSELFMAPEMMYCSLELPSMVEECTKELPDHILKECFSNILITGIVVHTIKSLHSALKLEKSAKKHYLYFQKWQTINFCTRKKFKPTKNAIFGLKRTQDIW